MQRRKAWRGGGGGAQERGVDPDLQTAKKTAPLVVESLSLALKSSAAWGKRAASRGSTTACLLVWIRCHMLAPATASVLHQLLFKADHAREQGAS